MEEKIFTNGETMQLLVGDKLGIYLIWEHEGNKYIKNKNGILLPLKDIKRNLTN